MTFVRSVRRVAASSVAVAVVAALASACGSFGFDEEPNPFDAICAHQARYLEAVDSGTAAERAAALEGMRADVDAFPGDEVGTQIMVRIVRQASSGDPSGVRNYHEGNCLFNVDLPSPR